MIFDLLKNVSMVERGYKFIGFVGCPDVSV